MYSRPIGSGKGSSSARDPIWRSLQWNSQENLSAKVYFVFLREDGKQVRGLQADLCR